METSGMLRLQTDTDGKLTAFEAVPPQVEKPSPPAPAFDWSRLFQAAGLNMAAYQSAEPLWTPLAACDARAAWTGVDAPTGAHLRIEAAAWRGRPVFFRLIGPWTTPERVAPASNASQVPVMIIIYIALTAACVIAWINFRAGRTDPRGATHLFLIYFLAQSAAGLLNVHHTATQGELNLFWLVVSGALLNGILNWVFYAALEPWVRRKWPQTIITWSRFVTKGIRDPLVGRDLLYGTVFGLALNLGNVIGPALHGNSGQPNHTPLDTLLGVRREIAALIGTVPPAILTALLFFFLLFLLRLLLRKEWLAAVAFVALIGVTFTLGTTTPSVDYPLSFAAFAVFAFALLRFGLLAAIVTSATGQIVGLGGLLDFSTWYAGMSAIPFVVVAAIAAYGFKMSLGGRALFKLET